MWTLLSCKTTSQIDLATFCLQSQFWLVSWRPIVWTLHIIGVCKHCPNNNIPFLQLSFFVLTDSDVHVAYWTRIDLWSFTCWLRTKLLQWLREEGKGRDNLQTLANVSPATKYPPASFQSLVVNGELFAVLGKCSGYPLHSYCHWPGLQLCMPEQELPFLWFSYMPVPPETQPVHVEWQLLKSADMERDHIRVHELVEDELAREGEGLLAILPAKIPGRPCQGCHPHQYW